MGSSVVVFVSVQRTYRNFEIATPVFPRTCSDPRGNYFNFGVEQRRIFDALRSDAASTKTAESVCSAIRPMISTRTLELRSEAQFQSGITWNGRPCFSWGGTRG